MIKEYILENPKILANIAFFILTVSLFIFNMVYALRMKKKDAELIAMQVINDEN